MKGGGVAGVGVFRSLIAFFYFRRVLLLRLSSCFPSAGLMDMVSLL
jgi:hypothetical protein